MFRVIFRPIALYVFSLFFDDKYLKGRYFTENYIGFGWALRSIWLRNILRIYKANKIPCSTSCIISNHNNIEFHPDDLHIFQVPGTYYQNFSGYITIGQGSYIAPNVGLITANHDFADLDGHTQGKDIKLGKQCWIGMNSVILPGVTLGDNTVVAAGAVVSRSFHEGKVVIGGVPAKIIKHL